ncbi:hypothetical protein PG994_001428 [Apiospora phragmitis]|uniref:Uncharacterized protein n=1 Tax=Apiospora phragmitis TaxID=2905665 RepID=A0ABR1WTH5_9PEZI
MEDNYSRGWEDVGYMCLLPPLVAQQFISCATSEFNAFRFRYISPRHIALAVAVFYPGLCYACGRLYAWADGLDEHQARLSREANRAGLRDNRHLTAADKAALPRSPREIGYMSPQFAPAFFAALALNLRARRLDRSLATCYQVWSPHSRVGASLLGYLRQAITSTPMIGAGASLACLTLWDYKKEADKHHERTL